MAGHHSASPQFLICDAWYGFPPQKGPRRERVRAVSLQLCNFIKWQQAQRQHRQQQRNGEKQKSVPDSHAKIVVLGAEKDVLLLKKRVEELLTSFSTNNIVKSDEAANIDSMLCSLVSFLPNISLEEWWCSHEHRLDENAQVDDAKSSDESSSRCEQNRNSKSPSLPGTLTTRRVHTVKDENSNDLDDHSKLSSMDESAMIYLSPDAGVSLANTTPPPKVVVIGMLVDRKIQPGRSLKRVQDLVATPLDGSNKTEDVLDGTGTAVAITSSMASISLQDLDGSTGNNEADTKGNYVVARRLPLDSFQNIHPNEPLNIDTIMELLQRWWWKEEEEEEEEKKRKVNQNNTAQDSRIWQNVFAQATIEAMESHHHRHPNRTLHKPM